MPIAATVTSGLTILRIVPGVDAGIADMFDGMNRTGIDKSVAKRPVSITDPVPVTLSVRFKLVVSGTSSPAPTAVIGPIQISPVS